MSTEEMLLIREQLEKVSSPGTDPIKQAAVVTWAMQYQGAYYQTRAGCLRRVFPKATEVVAFHGVPQSQSGKALMGAFKGDDNAAN